MFKCPHCGDVDHLLIDGYGVGDRLLEGVQFEIRLVDGEVVVKVEEKAKRYFSQLNEGMWLKTVKELVEEEGYASCPKCRDDVELSPDSIAPKTHTPLPAPMTLKAVMKDILGKKNEKGGDMKYVLYQGKRRRCGDVTVGFDPEIFTEEDMQAEVTLYIPEGFTITRVGEIEITGDTQFLPDIIRS